MKYWNVDCKTNDLHFIQKKGPLCFVLKNTNVNRYCIQAQTNSVQILIHVDFDLMNTNLKFHRFNIKHSLNPKFSIYHYPDYITHLFPFLDFKSYTSLRPPYNLIPELSYLTKNCVTTSRSFHKNPLFQKSWFDSKIFGHFPGVLNVAAGADNLNFSAKKTKMNAFPLKKTLLVEECCF
jgi:hypothetical protein